MGLFSKKPVSQLGVDIGAHGIKIVEVSPNHGRANLINYGYINFPESKDFLGDTTKIDEMAGLLSTLTRQMRVQSRVAIAGIPVSSVFGTIITIPKGIEAKERNSHIEREATKFSRLPLEQIVIDWKKIEEKQKKDSLTTAQEELERILITAAPKSIVEIYTKLFQKAGLSLSTLETETFALIRSLIGKDETPSLVLDLGATRSNLYVIIGGIPYLHRSIKVGGDIFDRMLIERLHISKKYVEAVKDDVELIPQFRKNHADFEPILEPVSNPIVKEIEYTLELYRKQSGGKGAHIDRVILTGGTAFLPHLDEYISEKFQIRSYIGDPWSRIIYPEELKPILDEIGVRFSIALGLSMYGIL